MDERESNIYHQGGTVSKLENPSLYYFRQITTSVEGLGLASFSTQEIVFFDYLKKAVLERPLSIPRTKVLSEAIRKRSTVQHTQKREILDLLRCDPQCILRVLNAANTSAKNEGKRTSSLDFAVLRLGMEDVRAHLFSAPSQQFFDKCVDYHETADQLWRHACLTAFLSGRLARKNKLYEEFAYLGALFSLSSPLLLFNLAADLRAKLGEKKEPVEWKTFQRFSDVLSPQLGGLLLCTWKLDLRLVNVVEYFQDDQRLGKDELLRQVRIAAACATYLDQRKEFGVEWLKEEMERLGDTTPEATLTRDLDDYFEQFRYHMRHFDG